jgi:hypothetical protein
MAKHKELDAHVTAPNGLGSEVAVHAEEPPVGFVETSRFPVDPESGDAAATHRELDGQETLPVNPLVATS